jgi:hypothetical protein
MDTKLKSELINCGGFLWNTVAFVGMWLFFLQLHGWQWGMLVLIFMALFFGALTVLSASEAVRYWRQGRGG